MNLMKKAVAAVGAMAVIGAGSALMGAGVNAEVKPSAAIGQAAPDFTLTDLDGNSHTLSDLTEDGNVVVLEWFNPDCPFVRKHYRDDTGTMVNMEKDMAGKNVVWLRVNSGHEGHPTADHDHNAEMAEKWGITSPILMDHSGDVGRMYGAKRTPEMYVIDSSGTLVYHGAIDNRSDAAGPGDENYVRAAVGQVLDGKGVSKPQTKAYGCSVKYD